MQLIEGNWIDLIIIAVLIYFVVISLRAGFIAIVADFTSFLLSLLVSLKFYSLAAELLRKNFELTNTLSNALGFLLTAVLAEAFLGILFSVLLKKIPGNIWKHKLNKILGIVPALGQALILISFFLTVIMGLPLSPDLKEDVSDSQFGSFLVRNTTIIEAQFNDIFGGVVQDTLTYLTIQPGSEETVPITVTRTILTFDEVTERAMLDLVNKERQDRGIAPLTLREEALPAARAHARDMWERKYFGHYSPEGETVGDRLEQEEVNYTIAGENLALAPTLETAHAGLMNSQGHRENILEARFNQAAIGVVDNGIYGKMFVQVFTD